ncbi:MAG TPA: hypothetical protein VMD91_06950 [Candidatus Sulfotelmatobacter sp.]|nr:hypothetical protein [Candidatus Sulfotelmatobacter sp.]
MNLRSLAAPAAALACVLTAAPCAAAGATKPLRTLVYDLHYTAFNRSNEQTSGFTGGGGGAGTGGGDVERTSDIDDHGTLTIDVIAATQDGGLVVDTTYSGQNSMQPKLRVAIFSDGRLGMDPAALPSVATLYLAPLLARGLVAGRNLDTGVTWTEPAQPGVKGDWNYKVTGIDGDVATLEVDATRSVAGPRGFDETDSETTRYDTTKLCPVAVDLTTTSHHVVATQSQYVMTKAHLTATLVSDTFANR